MRHAHQIVINFSAVFLLCLSLATPSNAQNEAFEAADQVPASIHSAMSGGYWTAGKDEGFFRVVVVAGGVEHVWHRLYIQWLRSDAKTQGYELVRTVNVQELNLGQGYLLEVKTSFGNFNSFKIEVTAKSLRVKTKRFAITAKGDGKYVIRSR
jgi:hypothetical protein